MSLSCAERRVSKGGNFDSFRNSFPKRGERELQVEREANFPRFRSTFGVLSSFSGPAGRAGLGTSGREVLRNGF